MTVDENYPDVSGHDMETQALLRRARLARQGRDLWREVGPIIAALVALGVKYSEIHRVTGIAPGTAHAKIGNPSSSTGVRT